MNSPVAAERLAQVEAAASCVLQAERAALAQIEQCEREALRLIAEGNARAERVPGRTEARIERFRRRLAAAAQLQQQRIRCATAALTGDIATDVPVPASLDAALAGLVEELVGHPESG